MKSTETNAFITELGTICREHPLAEKWLLAPSLRVGYQWLDRLALCGRPTLNVRVKTLRSLAMDLAGPALVESGRSLLTGTRSQAIMGSLFEELASNEGGYLGELAPGASLIDALSRVMGELRMAGLTPDALRTDSFEVADKGRQLSGLLENFVEALNEHRLADWALVVELARKRLKDAQPVIPRGTLVLAPKNAVARLAGRERELWNAIGEKHRQIISEDDVESTPRSLCNKTAEIFGAVGEVNEVREVLRRCVHGGAPLDDIEIIVSDRDTYLSMLHEAAARLGQGSEDRFPISFADGVPVSSSRPARALLGWLEWVQGEFDQATLVRLIQDGLLVLELPDDVRTSPLWIGEVLREVPIGRGAKHYLPQIDRFLVLLKQKKSSLDPVKDKKRIQRIDRKARVLHLIHSLISDLMPAVPEEETMPTEDLLEKAAVLIDRYSRVTCRFDWVSRGALSSAIDSLLESSREQPSRWLDAFAELTSLARATRVERQGPLPGSLFVSSLRSGGHSGRAHTYILGLDDSRFPGAGLQDPLLLDEERMTQSDALSTAQRRLAEKVKDFSRLLARLRGQVCLSFCCRSLSDDRRMFPSSPLMNAYRVLSGEAEGDQESFFEWLDPPISFSAAAPERAADPADWYLSTLIGDPRVKNALRVVENIHPHLGRGRVAREQRASNLFTEYDGYVPEAGRDHSPYRKDARPISASRLEALGSCPLDYFFSHVLGISPPEEHGIDETVWLDPLDRGTLLHDVFRVFMAELQKKNRKPSLKTHWKLLRDTVSQHLADARKQLPPPSDSIFARECRDIEKIAEIFLRQEETHCLKSTPAFFEVSIGLPREGDGTPLDSEKPVQIILAKRKRIFARGRIDRVDEVKKGKSSHYALWDYKTGSAYKYRQSDPFRGGRIVQPALYMELLAAHLARSRERLKPGSFGYFFPGLREFGARIPWSSDELTDGPKILVGLCDLLASGCFPETESDSDIKFSDYSVLRENPQTSCEIAKKKIINAGNDMLAGFADLRGLTQEKDNG